MKAQNFKEKEFWIYVIVMTSIIVIINYFKPF